MKSTKSLVFFLASMFFFLGLEAKSADRIVYNQEGQVEEAFISYATANYFPLLEVLLDSIQAFSSRPIVAFGINADIPFSTEKYPFLIKKRMDLESASVASIFYAKAKTILDSGVSRGVYVDSDIILNKGCDELFTICQQKSSLPFCPVHPSPPGGQEPLMHALGVKEKSMPYVHADMVVFSEEALPFIEKWYETNQNYHHLASYYDETVLNVVLWKYQAREALPICDPYFTIAYDYLEGVIERHHRDGYGAWIDKIRYLTFHGCKDEGEAKRILQRLIEKGGQ